MEIFVYSDESGVFDYVHNDIFVFGGLILLSKEDKNGVMRKYRNVEKTIRTNKSEYDYQELKACRITAKEKYKIFKSLNDVIKFGVIVNQKRLMKQIFNDKKTKQRYLDYVYKIALKRAFKDLIQKGVIRPDEVNSVRVYVDEHTTATNGKYELKESLEQEFKNGTFNYNYQVYHPPIFTKLNILEVNFCDSESNGLIRAADIVANMIYYKASNNNDDIYEKPNMYLIKQP